MSHIVLREPWGIIDIDSAAGRAFVRQDWRYTWHTIAPATPWTLAEKRSFHDATDRAIWGRWSNRLTLKVAGASPFCATFAAAGVPINFDVRWVLAGGQWSVNAHKTPLETPVGKYHQNCSFDMRTINLYTSKLKRYQAGNAAGARRRNFSSTPHEFGHALGNDDEYHADSVHLADDASTMNIGSQIRARHLSLVVASLNKMIPGAVFSM